MISLVAKGGVRWTLSTISSYIDFAPGVIPPTLFGGVQKGASHAALIHGILIKCKKLGESHEAFIHWVLLTVGTMQFVQVQRH